MVERRAQHARHREGSHPTIPERLAQRRSSPRLWRVRLCDRPVDRFVEANLSRVVDPGQVNVSYGIFQPFRGRGLALLAIDLMEQYLRTSTEARQIVVRIAPANTASLRVAEKAGFTLIGVFDEPEGRLVRYVRDICR